MAPSSRTPRLNDVAKLGTRVDDILSIGEITTVAENEGISVVESDKELVTIFRSELTAIRIMVTCSICDQLLYEPWTLACGHTYCYSCLCNWFVPNRRKKTCPDCRSPVKLMPAPAFLVKQMVEALIKRSELMPSDESIEQHTQKRLEEIADVERDRSGSNGLFKGTFPAHSNELWFDPADGVLRCPSCGHEHEGGPTCALCGIELDDEDEHDFSEGDADDFDDTDDTEDDGLREVGDLGFDLDAQEAAHVADRYGPHFINIPPSIRHHYRYNAHSPTHSESYHLGQGSNESDGDDSGFMQDFIVNDDEPDQSPDGVSNGESNGESNGRGEITIIDDDSEDEGGAVSNRRRRRATWRSGRTVEPSPSFFTVTDESTNGSEAGDMNREAEMLRHAGWSPLDQGNESDGGVAYNGFEGVVEDDDDEDDSGTETMIGNGLSDDEEDEQSLYNHSPPQDIQDAQSGALESYESEGDEADDDDSEIDLSTDRDGDTEMSVSPRAPRGRTRSIGGSGSDVEGATNISRPSVDGYSSNRGEYLGGVSNIQQIEDDDSDGSIRPPPTRRIARRYHPSQRTHQSYDPRISMMIAEHQQSLRGAQERSSEASNDLRHLEPASRMRRSVAGYRLPTRRADPRSSRSPSVTVIISTSSGIAPRGQRRELRRN